VEKILYGVLMDSKSGNVVRLQNGVLMDIKIAQCCESAIHVLMYRKSLNVVRLQNGVLTDIKIAQCCESAIHVLMYSIENALKVVKALYMC
jgi:hypothetical protein